MKKFTFLLSLLAMVLCNVQSAFADEAKWVNKGIATFGQAITSLDNLNDGYYVLRNVGRKTFVKAEGEALKLSPAVQSTNFADFQNFFQYNTDVAYVFYLKKNTTESGKFSIQGKTGKYFPKTSSADKDKDLSLNATEYEYTIKHIDGKAFGLNSGSFYLDGKAPNGNYQNGTVVPWNDASTLPRATGNGAYEFYPVTLGDAFPVNYTYMADGHEVLKVDGVMTFANRQISAKAYPYMTITSYSKNTITGNDNVTVNCTMSLPIVGSTVENPKYYAINIHTGKNKWCANDDGVNINCPETENTLPELSDNYQWAFIGEDLLSNFKIYNKGTKKYIKTNGENAATLTDNVSEATSFRVKASNAQNVQNGFCFFHDEDGSKYLNMQSNGLKTWNAGDNGSSCVVYAPESFALNYATFYYKVPTGALGACTYLATENNHANLKKAYDNVVSNPTDENIKALEAINKGIAASETPATTFTEGYYRLFSSNDYNYLHYNGSNLSNQSNKEKAVGSVFYFKSTGEAGKFNVLVEGKYLGAITKSTPVLLGNDANKGTYTVENITNFAGKIHEETNSASENEYHYLHVNNPDPSNLTANAVGWTKDAPASTWYIVPATDVEVAMNSVGEKTYATAYLPFPVSAVSGAEAYVGTLNGAKDQLNMTKVTGVPAETGIVLVGTKNKATLTIGGEATVTGTNSLTGTLVDKTIADEQANYLVFGKNNADNTKVGFFKPTVETIPANKAYLDATGVAGAIAMNFGGNTTSVNTVVLGENGVNAPVFDLSGRRVVAPVKGGVYIQNGKKFIK